VTLQQEIVGNAMQMAVVTLQPGQTVYCEAGKFQGIQYGVQRVGGLNRQGIMNAVFGGEGLSLATLEGNGRVILLSTNAG
jgi:uncharacterized protein (AIM24 family)